MDRKDREREQLSTLLANLYPNTISQDQMAKGFTRLLHFTEVGHLLMHLALHHGKGFTPLGLCWSQSYHN